MQAVSLTLDGLGSSLASRDGLQLLRWSAEQGRQSHAGGSRCSGGVGSRQLWTAGGRQGRYAEWFAEGVMQRGSQGNRQQSGGGELGLGLSKRALSPMSASGAPAKLPHVGVSHVIAMQQLKAGFF